MRCSITLVCFALVCTSSSAQSIFGSSPPSDLQAAAGKAEGLIAKAKELCGPNVGEAGIGFGAGCVAGFACKKVQNMIVGAAVLGGAVAGGACLAGWVKPEELVDKAEEAVDAGAGYLSGLLGTQEKLTKLLPKSKVAMTKLVKNLPGIVGGAAMGGLVGYRLG